MDPTNPGGDPSDDPDQGQWGTEDAPFTTVEAYNAAVEGSAWDGEDIYLTIEDEIIEAGEFALRNVQNRVNPPRLHLSLTDCHFYGNTSGDTVNPSFMYLSNCQELMIDNCIFNTTSTKTLRYGINWNLIQIQNATVKISNSSFQGTYLENALKLNQRNGPDDKALDVKGYDSKGYTTWKDTDIIPATIASAQIENCNAGSNAVGAVLALGSAGKNDGGGASPSTGAFPLTIVTGSHPMDVFLAYRATDAEAVAAQADPRSALDAGLAIQMPRYMEGTKYEKTAQGDPIGPSGAEATIDGVKYATLQSALRAAQDGDTIVLQQYAYLTQSVDVDKEVTLDLNGCLIMNNPFATWNGSDYLVAVKRGGELTVTDSSDPSTGQIITEGDDILCAVKMTVLGEAATGEPATLTVEGGTISGYGYGIAGNGNRHNTNIWIAGGVVKSQAEDGIAIYQPQRGNLTIWSGTIQSPNTAIEIRAGYLSVSGDAVIQGGDGTPAVNSNGNGGTTSNTGIAVAQHTTGRQIDVKISGGQIFGGAALYESNPQGNDGSSSVIINIEGDAALTGGLTSSGFGDTTVTGGQINGDVTYSGTGQLLLQEGATVTGGVVNDNAAGILQIINSTVAGEVTGDANIVNSYVGGQLTTNTGDAVALVGDTTYDSLDDAVAEAVKSNQVVYLLRSAELTEKIDGVSALQVQPGAVLATGDPALLNGYVHLLAGSGLKIPNGERVLETFVGSGDDARVRLTEGRLIVNFNSSGPSLELGQNSAAEIPAGKELVVQKGFLAGIELNATLTVRGKLTLANDSSLWIYYGGVLDVASGGIFRVNSRAKITDPGATGEARITNGGTIALMQGGDNRAAVEVPITLRSGGVVYSQFDASDLTIEKSQAATLDPAVTVDNVANDDEIEAGKELLFGYQYTYHRTGGGTVPSSAPAEEETEEAGLPFTDVDEDAWYYEAVAYAYETGMMNGTADTVFSPNLALTRGMLVTMLYRLEENPAGESAFADVDPAQYYADPVAWAAANGIVTGYGDDGTFGPEKAITREQLATILWRYAKYKGYDVSVGEDTNILSYLDVAEVSEYAIPAFQWACGSGVMEGVGEGRLAPQAAATRAQVAAMAMRFCQNVAK